MATLHLKNNEEVAVWKEIVSKKVAFPNDDIHDPKWLRTKVVADGELGLEGPDRAAYRNVDIDVFLNDKDIKRFITDCIRWARSRFYTEQYPHISTFFSKEDWKDVAWKKEMLFKAPFVNVYSIYRNRLAKLGVTRETFNESVREVWKIKVTDEDVRKCLEDIQNAIGKDL